MEDLGIVIIIIAIFIAGVVIYLNYIEKQAIKFELEKQKRRELAEAQARAKELERLKIYNYFKERIDIIVDRNSHFADLINCRNGYFTYQQMKSWVENNSSLFNDIKDKSYNGINLSTKDVNAIITFKEYCTDYESLRSKANKIFIENDLKKYSTDFDKVENRRLDEQQRLAIVTDEDNNIVIAGAGSGKTTTIVGKVEYIFKRYKVLPEELLLISFTKKSAQQLSSRIKIEGVEVKTFHKFGMDVIASVEQKQPSIFDESQYDALISRFLNHLILDSSYLKKITSYFINFLKPLKQQDDFKNQGQYFQYLKDLNFATYKAKSIEYKGKITIKREVVKSAEECQIGNFLLFNGIEYEYEYPYVHETALQSFRQYKPDFTIMSNGKIVYLEHFAINSRGQVPHFFANKNLGQTVKKATEKYIEGIEWKRQLHNQYNTVLIETYSHEMFDKTLFDKLKLKLIEAGVKFTPKTPQEIWEIIAKSAKDEVESLVRLFQTFITLMKSNNYTIGDVTSRNNNIEEKFYRERNALFIEIIKPIIFQYEQHLFNRKEIDFSDMINKAIGYVSNKKFKSNFKYIIVDEFQDISIGRYKLLKALKDKNPSCKLFCVGDDWQSIYRFTGSDISLFKDFEKYFGYSEKSKIETTYRFNNPLLNLSSDFILKNPNQSQKSLKNPIANRETNYKIVYSSSENQDDTFALQNVFNELISCGSVYNKEILILGRYSFDFKRIKNEENVFTIDKQNETLTYHFQSEISDVSQLTAKFMTVHKSKGLEADIIVLINCNAGKFGFPSGMSDDPVLNLLLSEADQFENGEERRLFYVAMTRAKESLFLITESSYKSKFINELELQNIDSEIKKCPRCVTADLFKRTGQKDGKQWSFYGCSNYLYGCDYKEWVNIS